MTSPDPAKYLKYNDDFFSPLARWYDLFAVFSQGAVRRGLDLCGSLAGRQVLDLCTGTGAVAFEAARRGGEVTGVDACDAMLTRARATAERTGLAVEFRLQGAAEVPPEELSEVDVVTISLGLHDMPRKYRETLLTHLAKAPVKELVVIDYGFPDFAPLAWFYEKIVASFETVFFPNFIRWGGIRGHLERAGFEVKDLRTVFPGFFQVARAVPGESP